MDGRLLGRRLSLMFESTITLEEPAVVLSIFGARDKHLRRVRDALGVAVSHREGELHISGEETDVQQATEVMERLKRLAQKKGELASEDVSKVLGQVTGNKTLDETQVDVITTTYSVKPRTAGQQRYLQAIRGNDLVFAVGPAGSGKTYLAVAAAVEALKHQEIRKIVLVRPAVEAGESLGFLPGDLQAKINPYLRPLLDALNEMIDHDQIKRYMEMDVIEVLPLAYMRGRTLNNAFIILDEAQNTTIAQMKMFLTRMGEGSKIVVSGDTTQIDLPPNTRSGLIDALSRLRQVKGVDIAQLTNADIVRHRLVQAIVDAYEDDDSRSRKRRKQES